VHSIESFAPLAAPLHDAAAGFIAELEALVASPEALHTETDETVYVRNPAVAGPMNAFGYSYLEDKYGAEKQAQLRLPQYSGTHGNGGEYAYEALNLVDGKRTLSEIRNWLTAELGPVPLDIVSEYLEALRSIDVLSLQLAETEQPQ
jgi:aminopeptidase YwaD